MFRSIQICFLEVPNNNPSNRMFRKLTHQSLQAEHGIKSLTHILTKHLTSLGEMWTKYLSLGTFAYNTFNSPNLGNYSPYELNFW